MADVDWDKGQMSPPPAAGGTDWDAGAMAPPSAKGFMSDVGTALKQGVQQLPGMVTGLADIPLGLAGFNRPVSRAAERLGEATGFQPGRWAQETAQTYSPETQAARADIDAAWDSPDTDALDVAGAYLRTPRATALNVVQSVPSIVAGGVAGRVVGGLAGLASAPARAAIGEGAVMAGQQMDQIDDSVDARTAALAALGTGAAGAAVGALGGSAAARLGVRDIDSTLAGGMTGQAARTPGLPARVATGAAQEAAEEAVQSSIEQGAQNWAEDRPLMQGMARGAFEGALAGSVLGAGAGVIRPSQRMGLDPEAGPLSAAAATAVDSGATPLALPAPTVTVDAAGNARTAEQRQAERDAPGTLETGAMGLGRNSEADPAAAFGMADRLALPAPAIEVDAAGQAMTTEQRQAQREDPGPRETGAIGRGRNSESLGDAAQQAEPMQPTLGYDNAPTNRLIGGADGVRPETRAEAVNRAQQQRQQHDAEQAEAQRRDSLGLPPLTPIEPVRPSSRPGETLELGPDGIARPVDLLPEPTNRIRAAKVARDAGPGHEVHKVQGGWNVRRIESGTPGATDETAGRTTSAPRAAPASKDYDGPTMQEVMAIADVPTVQVMREAISLVGEAEFQRRAQQKVEQYTAGGKYVGNPSLYIEAEARAIVAKHRGQQARDGITALTVAANKAATSPANDLPEPTPAQKEAGNYAKGHMRLLGMDISIENPAGSTRSGVDPGGKPWHRQMRDHYGYIRRTEGADGDHVDAFIGPKPASSQVFVVDQLDQKTGRFDEHKVMIGYGNRLQAIDAYRKNFDRGWKVGPVTSMSVDSFKGWLKDGDTTEPVSELHKDIAADLERHFQADLKADLQAKRGVKPAKPAAVARPKQSPLRAFLAQHGIDPGLAADITGERGLRANQRLPRTFRKGGRQLDELVTLARERGFLTDADIEDAGDTGGTRRLVELIQAELRGERAVTTDAADDVAADRAAAKVGDDLQRQAEAIGFDTRGLTDQQVADSLRRIERKQAKAGMGRDRLDVRRESVLERLAIQGDNALPDTDSITDDLDAWLDNALSQAPRHAPTLPKDSHAAETANGPNSSAEAAGLRGRDGQIDPRRAKEGVGIDPRDPGRAPRARGPGEDVLTDAGANGTANRSEGQSQGGHSRGGTAEAAAGAPQSGDRADPRAEGQAAGLTSPTRADIEAQQERTARGEREQTQTQQEQERRARADADRGEFTLTGSDRPADVAAAAGQGGLFDAVQQSHSAPPPADTDTAKPTAGKIDDIGEKIGGARKDTAARGSDGAKRRDTTDDDRPAWARRFKISLIGKSTKPEEEGRWTIYDTRALDWLKQPRQRGGTYATQEEAEAALPLLAVALKHHPVPLADGQWEIWRTISERKRVKVVDQVFASREAALAYMARNPVTILETSTTFGESDLPVPEDKGREGPVRRQGNVDGQAFRDAFGFRGVEFGNWNNQAERQEVMNEAYDGLVDLAEAVGVPPMAISLDGQLALAFGARGQGLNSARAHYELQRAVINLTKMNGAGALAHEWFHALDHHFGRQDGKASAEWITQPDGTRTLKSLGAESDMASTGFSGVSSGVRPEVREAYKHLMNTLVYKAEEFVQDTAKADRFVAQSREEVAERVADIRRDLAAQKDVRYYKRHNKPASTDQLAEFDTVAQSIVDGVALDLRAQPVGSGKSYNVRWTNEALEQISAIYKAVRGRSGFDTTSKSGVLDRLRGDMGRYEQRMKMLAGAQQSPTAERRVLTDFVMDARSLDQGRGTNYWTSPPEMAARAFQAFVEDKIAERGGRSPFLNHAPEGAGILTPWGAKRPFPAGLERRAMNAAFERLLGMLQTTTGDDGNVTLSSAARQPGAGAAAGEQHRTAIERAVTQAVSGWAGRAPTVVVRNPSDARVDRAVREHYAQPGRLVPAGSYHAGTVYLFTDHIADPAEARTVLIHETVGHHGLREVFGDRLNSVLDTVARTRRDEIARKAHAYRLDLSRQNDARAAAEEVLADMAEQDPRLPLVRRAIAAIRTWLREHIAGLRALLLTDDEIVRNYLAPARRFIERGPASERVPSTAMPAASQAGSTGAVHLELQGWEGTRAQMRELATGWYGARLQGTSVRNDDLGADIQFTSEGKRTAFATSGNLRSGWRAEMVRVLPELVRRARKISEAPPDARRVHDTRAFHTLTTPLLVSGHTYAAKITVREALHDVAGKQHKFYDVTALQIENGPEMSGAVAGVATGPLHPTGSEPSRNILPQGRDTPRAHDVTGTPAPAVDSAPEDDAPVFSRARKARGAPTDGQHPYQADLFGEALAEPDTGPAVPGAAGDDRPARPDGSGVRGDAQPGPGVPDTPAPDGEYFAQTYVGVEARRRLGAALINSAADAAAATRYLYDSAVERFDGIVTNAAGKPLAVIGGFKGALSQASVYPATLIAEAVRIPGAAKIWFSHNHPSGQPELSRADENLYRQLASVFEGSGIEPQGLIAVAGDRFHAAEGVAGHVWGMPEAIGPTSHSVEVPAIERRLQHGGVAGAAITSPQMAKDLAGVFYDRAKSPGIMLVNSQHHVVGWVPITPDMMRPLRGGALHAVYRAVSQANAGAAIIVHGGELGSSQAFRDRRSASANIGAALREGGARPLDVIDVVARTSAAEQGLQMASDSVMSRRPAGERTTGATGMPPASVQAQVEAIRSGWKNAPGVVVVDSLRDPRVPEQVRGTDARQRGRGDLGAVEGFFHGGKVYLVADQLHRLQDVARVLMHEALGHYGLRGVFGSRMAMLLNQLAVQNAQQVRAAAEGLGLDFDKPAERRVAAEEVLAYMAQNNPQLSWVRNALAAIRSWLREQLPNLANMRQTDDELVRNFLMPARAWVQSGAGSAPRGFAAVQFSRAPAADSEAFRRWFAGSKVVDAQGRPLMLYHGTKADFAEFDLKMFGASDQGLAGKGFYFTYNPEEASSYALNEQFGRGDAPNVRQVYVSMSNPFVITQGVLPDGRTLKDLHGGTSITKQGGDALRRLADEGGHDGVMWVSRDGAVRHAFAFEPGQVKSAIGNRRTIDPANGDAPVFSRASSAGAAMGALTPAQQAAWKRVAQLRQTPTLRERFDALRANLGTKMRQGMLDQFAPIKAVSQAAYVQARLSKGSEGTMEAALLYGRPFLRDGVPDVDMRDGGFAQVLASLKGEHDRFLMWVAAQRAERLQAEGKENLFTGQDIGALKTLNAGRFDDGAARTPVYAAALQALNAMNDSVLALAAESGLIDPAARDLFKDQPYVPFYRMMEEGDMRGPRFSSGLVNQQAWKKLKGGSQQLNADLLENMLLNWAHLYSAAARNRAAQATMDAAGQIAVAHQVPEGTKGAVRVMRGGTAQHWAVEDPYLLDAITSLNYAPSPLMKPLATMKNLLTYTVTANPTFKVRNLIRDSLSAISQADLSFNPLRNVGEGWQATAKDSQVYASMLASGGTIRFGTQENSTRLRRQVEDLGGRVLDPQGWRKLTGQLRTAWGAYEELGDRVENVNRAALYQQLIGKGHSHADAAFMSRDLMDFSMSGAWPLVRFLGQTVPFFNARLQGLYKLGRAAAEDPRRFGTMAGAVALASLGLIMAYGDDEDWKKREDWDRDAYWWFKIGGTAVRIPKPFELGAIGTVAERTAELMVSDEMTGQRFGRRISDMVFGTFAMDPTPQIIKPLLDVSANKDSFTGRPIEGLAEDRLRPQDRAGERTTEVARMLGQLGLPDPVQLAKGEYSQLSPKQVDFLLRGYFGWVGTTGAQMGDLALRPLMGRGERPAMELRDTFLAGNFVESLPSGGSRYVTQLYERSRAVEQAYASYRDAMRRGDIGRAAEIRQEEGEALRARGAVQGSKEQLTRINQQARMVEASGTMSAQAKRQRLDQLEATRVRVAKGSAPASDRFVLIDR